MDSKFFSPLDINHAVMACRGEGVYITDDNGKRYLDGSSGAMTVSLGHNNKEITDAVKNQLDLLAFTYRSQFTNEPLEELCREISSLAPGDLEYVSLANSGSEAAELAMKMAYSYWTSRRLPMKRRIISRWSSYHGSTVGALSMSGNAARRREYSPYVSDFPVLELPFCHLCPYEKKPSDCNLFCANHLQTLLNRFGAENVSAVICEPITGASGAGITPPEDYFHRIQEICRKNEVLLIMDEVITGFGRTGKYFASEHWDIVPDIIVFGKGITSGYFPLAGIIVRRDIHDCIEEKGIKFITGHTFGGNPLACASAIATIEFMKSRNIVKEATEKGVLLKKKLHELAGRCTIISDIRGKGLLWGVEFAKERTGTELFPPENNITGKIVKACFERGLIVYPSAGFIDGKHGDSVLLSPPLTITEKEIDHLAALLEASIHDVETNMSCE